MTNEAMMTVTEEMVEKALAAANARLSPKYIIDVRESWHEQDRAGMRAALEAVLVPSETPATKSDIRCPVCGWVCEEPDREES